MFSEDKARRKRTSLAAVFHGPDQALELRQIALPERLFRGEALVRITCCTLCGSDLSTLAGHRQEPTPCILGHEIVGVIAELGEKAATGDDRLTNSIIDLRGRVVQVGDRVVWSIAANCGNCRPCRRGIPQKCVELMKYGHRRMDAHWQLNGGMAEYCHLVRGTKIVVVASDIADTALAPASCATATVVAACRAAGNIQGARVLIIGAGLLGLTACAMVRTLGAESISVCDVSSQRLHWANRFGADHTLAKIELAASNDQKYDTIFELSGSSSATSAALSVADVGAAIVLVGSVRPAPPIEVFPEQLIRSVQSMHGVHNYVAEDLLAAVEFLEKYGHRFPFNKVVTRSATLTQIHTLLTSTAPAIRMAVTM
ncbi:MAG: alcohol dehydrogenase catalytic domain-containing protein [Aureliella sp.]